MDENGLSDRTKANHRDRASAMSSRGQIYTGNVENQELDVDLNIIRSSVERETAQVERGVLSVISLLAGNPGIEESQHAPSVLKQIEDFG